MRGRLAAPYRKLFWVILGELAPNVRRWPKADVRECLATTRSGHLIRDLTEVRYGRSSGLTIQLGLGIVVTRAVLP